MPFIGLAGYHSYRPLSITSGGELYNPNEVHTLLKTTCNYEERVNPATGEVVRVPKSSTKLTTYEWEKEFKQQIRQLCMDFFGLDLPEPEDN